MVKLTDAKIKALCDQYNASGRVVTLYPRKKRVSLNGGKSLTYAEAAQKIQEFLDA